MKKRKNNNQKRLAAGVESVGFSGQVIEHLVSLLGTTHIKEGWQRDVQDMADLAPVNRERVLAVRFEEFFQQVIDETELTRPRLTAQLQQLFGRRGVVLLTVETDQRAILLTLTLVDDVLANLEHIVGRSLVGHLVNISVARTALAELVIEGRIDWIKVKAGNTDAILRAAQALFVKLQRQVSRVFGATASTELLEGTYRLLFNQYPYLPETYRVMQLLPVGTLIAERQRRLAELEAKHDTSARGLASADAKLNKQAQKLLAMVERLEESNQELQKLDEARSNFVSVVSHDFRTPLSVIRWNVEMLKEVANDSLDDDSREALDMIDQRTNYLVHSLHDVMSVLQIDTGASKHDLRPSFLWELVSEAVEAAEPQYEKRGLTLSFDKSKDSLAQVSVDENKIKDVLRILLTNALNYSDVGGEVKLRLSLVKRRGEKLLCLEVCDQGIGIPVDELPRMFEKFFRGKLAIQTVPDGSGLGLYLVKNFVEGNGGEVVVESNGKVGTTVRVLLPCLEPV